MSQPSSSPADNDADTPTSGTGPATYPDSGTPAGRRSTGSTPRIRPGGLRELGPVGWAVNRLGARVTGKRDVHLFATLGHARRLFPAWLAYSGMMMPFGILDRRTT